MNGCPITPTSTPAKSSLSDLSNIVMISGVITNAHRKSRVRITPFEQISTAIAVCLPVCTKLSRLTLQLSAAGVVASATEPVSCSVRSAAPCKIISGESASLPSESRIYAAATCARGVTRITLST